MLNLNIPLILIYVHPLTSYFYTYNILILLGRSSIFIYKIVILDILDKRIIDYFVYFVLYEYFIIRYNNLCKNY